MSRARILPGSFFRNVKGVFPKYEEAFIEEGDTLIQAIKAYKDVGFDAVLILDHVPVVNAVSGSWHTGMAYFDRLYESLIAIIKYCLKFLTKIFLKHIIEIDTINILF